MTSPNLPIINYLFCIILLVSAAGTANGQTTDEIQRMQDEKLLLKHKIDSMQERITEIDLLLGRESKGEDREELMIRKYGKKKGPMIAAGRVWTGVSREMALDSWGEPEKKQKSEGPKGINETWYYPEGKYIYFENGYLARWKE